jgi:hypothetical protein
MATQPPFFYATRLAFFHLDDYRIYVLPEELLFLRSGTRTRPEQQLGEADLDELRRLAGSDPESFVAAISELADLRLEPPRQGCLFPLSLLWAPPCEHRAELCFTHAARGKYSFAMFYPSAEEVYRELNKLLGNKIALGMWSDNDLRLIKRP